MSTDELARRLHSWLLAHGKQGRLRLNSFAPFYESLNNQGQINVIKQSKISPYNKGLQSFVGKHAHLLKMEDDGQMHPWVVALQTPTSARSQPAQLCPKATPPHPPDTVVVANKPVSYTILVSMQDVRISTPAIVAMTRAPTCDIAFGCEFATSLMNTMEVSLLKVAFDAIGRPEPYVFIFDILMLKASVDFDASTVSELITAILLRSEGKTLVHDGHKDAWLLARDLQIVFTPMEGYSFIDTQLAFELLEGQMLVSLQSVLQRFGSLQHSVKDTIKKRMQDDLNLWRDRPLAPDLLRHAALDVILLVKCAPVVIDSLRESQLNQVVAASWLRLAWAATSANGERCFSFDPFTHVMTSHELVYSEDDLDDDDPALKVSTDLERLLELMPPLVADRLNHPSMPTFKLRDIIFDLGQPARAFLMNSHGNEMIVLSDELGGNVTQEHLENVLLKLDGKFGPDNRAGLNGCLHRISAMRNLQSDIYGLTFRVGRSVRGNATMINDLLMGSSASILVMGVPGTGKTTIVREICRVLAQDYKNCIVVDTSNEICGDGDVPHPSVGLARRMMVPSLAEQGKVMIECLQNHTPDVIVIDEIGRKQEVEAAKTVKQRGVRLVASAHGDLRTLMKNTELRGMIGGVETVTLGDEAAKKNHGSKLQAQRQGEPTFDVIIELTAGELHKWRVVTNVAVAVDSILQGHKYQAQQRRRDVSRRVMSLELVCN